MTFNCIGCGVPTISDMPWCEPCDETRHKIMTIIEAGKMKLSSAEIAEHVMNECKCKIKTKYGCN